MRLDLEDLGFDRGAHVLVARALRALPPGGRLAVHGRAPDLGVHLTAWCRAHGHVLDRATSGPAAVIVRGVAETHRWTAAERAGTPEGPIERPAARWGLAARGALVEAGGPEFTFPLRTRGEVWSDDAGRMYAQAAAAQWDPATAVAWDTEFALPDEVEDAIVQVMTYLVENETAALIVPARFAAQIHPHFREVMQLLALQAADEARHIEIFTRRARLRREHLGTSAVGGQVSLKTLIDEPDFALASFLLSVLGEGSFLALLHFLYDHAPDPVTREVARLAAQDEARHVAFGLAHLERHAREDPALRPRLAAAIQRRHDALRHTAGLNEDVFDALVILAAGAFAPTAVASGYERVIALEREMDAGRQRRLARLGFDADAAATLSALHTRNFM